MDFCICDISALEVYRSYGRLIPDLLEGRRTSKLDSCGLPSSAVLEEDLRRLGAQTRPFNLAFASRNRAMARDDVQRHIYLSPLPKNSFIKVKEGVLISSPELLFVELASHMDRDEIDLALLGYELCGTYVLDEDDESWAGVSSTGTSLTSKEKIARMIEGVVGRRGSARARNALDLFEDRSNSPMETVLALLVGLPRRLGGLGLGPISMNKKVKTSTGDRWVDIFFEGRNVGLEYKGRESHSIEKVGRDDRRQNKLTGSGVKILNVWYEDLVSDHLFDQLVQDIFDALGIRQRMRSKGFAQRQKLLRMRLAPAVQRYGSFL